MSNLYVAEPPIALAEQLLARAGRPGRVFFANSGAEANEAAFKLSRRTGRSHVVATDGGFHGRTMGALALTGQPAKADPFRPLPGEVTHVPYGDVDALAAAVTDETAMVILEPIQGENGVVVPPPGYLAAAREITAGHGALLVLDEVQTGIGRTGHWFAHQADGVEPDVMTLAKGLGGGLPLGAPGRVRRRGRPARAGRARLDVRRQPGLAARPPWPCSRRSRPTGCSTTSSGSGSGCGRGIEALGHPLVAGVRGAGLLLGDRPHRAGLGGGRGRADATPAILVNAVQPDVIRLAPPLILTAEQADAFVAALARRPGRTWWSTHDRHFLRDDDLSPGRAGRGARPGRWR